MKIKDFDKLEKKLNGQNFHESYGNINRVMTGLSYFGHIASIFLAFFMLSKILLGVMENQVLVYVVTVIILSAVELLKRDIFHKFSVLYLKLRTFGKDVMPLFFLSVAIIGISFYSSIKGAGEYSHKGEKIESDFEVINNRFEDSIKKVFDKKYVSVLENEIKTVKLDIDKKDALLNKLQGKTEGGRLNRDARAAIPDLRAQRKELEDDVTALEAKIVDRNKEVEVIIAEHHKKTNNQAKKKKSDNSTNSIAFVIFSTLIEISILAGVYFNDYYDVRSYREKRNQLEKDPNFQKWKLYNQILEIIYTEETKINQKLPSNKGIIEVCKMNEIIVLPKDVTNFLKTMATIGIVKVSGSTKYINKVREQAFEALGNHFGIE